VVVSKRKESVEIVRPLQYCEINRTVENMQMRTMDVRGVSESTDARRVTYRTESEIQIHLELFPINKYQFTCLRSARNLLTQ
jgi:hypothetical protein